MHYLVTGCAGFVGSTLVDRLLLEGHNVTGIDNFSTGFESFLGSAKSNPRFKLVRGDILDPACLSNTMDAVDAVFHFAANADVRFGTKHPRKDFEQNTLGTLNVLEAMRSAGTDTILFSSTGSIYGDCPFIPTPEDAPIPIQTSLYGASKLAAEAFIEAYCEGFGMRAFIFRFVSLLGERYTHGHVIDFYRQLKQHPGSLEVLGDGHQRKSYLYIGDCIDAMLLALAQCRDPVNIFNLGTEEYCEVTESIGWITSFLGLRPDISYTGGRQGWIGDNPFIFLDTKKIRNLGWQPSLSIKDAVRRTVQFLDSYILQP